MPIRKDRARLRFSQGASLVELSYASDRWCYVIEQAKVRYRQLYKSQRSNNADTYAARTSGATEADVEAIQRAMKTLAYPEFDRSERSQEPLDTPATASSEPVGDG